MEERYYIWSFKNAAWWRQGSWGFTVNLEEAETYNRSEALHICRSENTCSEPTVVEKVSVADEGRIKILTAHERSAR